MAEWRQAEAIADAAEHAAVAQALSFLDGSGPAPSQEQWEESKRLRAVANAMFQLVVAQWNPPRKAERSTATFFNPAGWGATWAWQTPR
jgi:hypothetical protein